jgi:hypothetical protein
MNELIFIELVNGKALVGKLSHRDDDDKVWVVDEPRMVVVRQDPRNPESASVQLMPYYGMPQITVPMRNVAMRTSAVEGDMANAYVQSTSKLDLTTKLHAKPSVENRP